MKKSLLSAVALTALIAFSGSAWADILIGVAGPITGPNAAFGAQLQKGAEQAVADINAAGGINRRADQAEVGDDVSDPKQGISVANKFVADGVKFVVGHFNSGVSIPCIGSLCRERHPRNHACRDQSEVHRARPVERVPHLRTRRPAGQGIAGAYIATNFKDAKIARHPRQDPLRPGPCRRNQEGDERQRRDRSHV